MQIQNPWVNKLYFGSPTSSEYIDYIGGDIQINSDLRISTASNDDALTRLLAWDPSTNIIKYRNTSSISGGGSGSQGFQGVQGDSVQGDAGFQGFQGRQGVQGIQGITGVGVDSVIGNYSGYWQGSPTVYVLESWVNYGGSTWFANSPAGDGIPPSPTNSNWTIFAGAGLIVGTAIPANSSATGSKGEIRVDVGQSLYIHNGDQWLRFSITASTF